MSVIRSLQDEYNRYKALAEAAIAQVGDEELGTSGTTAATRSRCWSGTSPAT